MLIGLCEMYQWNDYIRIGKLVDFIKILVVDRVVQVYDQQ